uniref:Putative secreted protein n=1 Tax=Ixodes ricinus TaxID=34613 RepID=A0A090X9G8_IXORI
MLLLKLTLVVLISVIGERALCTDSNPAPLAKENEKAPDTLPQVSLINNTDPNGCRYQVLPWFSDDGMDGGFLTVQCTKSCPKEIQETDADGNPCIVHWNFLGSSTDTIRVLVGECKTGSCSPGRSPEYRDITLGEKGSEEEEEEK